MSTLLKNIATGARRPAGRAPGGRTTARTILIPRGHRDRRLGRTASREYSRIHASCQARISGCRSLEEPDSGRRLLSREAPVFCPLQIGIRRHSTPAAQDGQPAQFLPDQIFDLCGVQGQFFMASWMVIPWTTAAARRLTAPIQIQRDQITSNQGVPGYLFMAASRLMPSATAAERFAFVAWISFILSPVRE